MVLSRKRRQQQFALYASPGQFQVWRQWAEAEGKSLTEWIRDTLDAVIEPGSQVSGGRRGSWVGSTFVEEAEYIKV